MTFVVEVKGFKKGLYFGLIWVLVEVEVGELMGIRVVGIFGSGEVINLGFWGFGGFGLRGVDGGDLVLEHTV